MSRPLAVLIGPLVTMQVWSDILCSTLVQLHPAAVRSAEWRRVHTLDGIRRSVVTADIEALAADSTLSLPNGVGVIVVCLPDRPLSTDGWRRVEATVRRSCRLHHHSCPGTLRSRSCRYD